ncbi:MAG TPA: hypothetical protein VMZ06_17405 [Candidatus Bathyarchaeia archaeon]|nr:hypothetical protein [Candidatus Bathyarchaeia archaeon]
MERNRERVRELLHQRILQGYRPTYTAESAEDFWVDWAVLTEDEFDAIIAQTEDELAKLK